MSSLPPGLCRRSRRGGRLIWFRVQRACYLFRHSADVDRELVAVRRVSADRQPDWHPMLVVPCPPCFDDGDTAVVSELEEPGFWSVWCSHRDCVAVADLLDPYCFAQVLDRSLHDVARRDKACGTSLGQAQGIEGGLQRPRCAIDTELLMPAHDRGALFQA